MSGDGDGDGTDPGPEAPSDGDGRTPSIETSGRPLHVDADLTVEVDPAGSAVRSIADGAPRSVEVWSDGSTVTIDAPSFRVARSLLSGLEGLPIAPDRIGDELDAAGVTLRVRVRRATVATLGPNVRPRYRPLSRLVGAPGAAVSLRGVVSGALRRLL